MSSGVSSVDFTDDLPDPEDEEFLVPGVEVGVGEADATLGADELPEDCWPIVISSESKLIHLGEGGA